MICGEKNARKPYQGGYAHRLCIHPVTNSNLIDQATLCAIEDELRLNRAARQLAHETTYQAIARRLGVSVQTLYMINGGMAHPEIAARLDLEELQS